MITRNAFFADAPRRSVARTVILYVPLARGNGAHRSGSCHVEPACRRRYALNCAGRRIEHEPGRKSSGREGPGEGRCAAGRGERPVDVERARARPRTPRRERRRMRPRFGVRDPSRRDSGRAWQPRARRQPSVADTRSAIAAVVRFVFARGIVGMTEASTTRRRSTPRTRHSESTTVPREHVPAGWK